MTNLKIKNLSYIYDQRKCDGVDRINLELSGGQLCSILGPSGSGKTTLLKILAKLLTPLKGSLEYSKNLKPALYLPLDTPESLGATASMTLLKYLSEGININEEQIRDQIAFMELSDEFYSPLKNLSTGQWHRAQLAKYFFTENNLLLLDEPFIHLDPSRRQFIAESLLQMAKDNDKIVVWSTHFLDDALMLADKILLLQHGVQQQFSSSSDMYWKPQNLFAANYFGENNLLIATPIADSKSVQTSFGKISLPADTNIADKEMLLMCRPHLCKIHTSPSTQDTFWNMKLEKISFFGAYKRLEFLKDNRKWWVDCKTSANKDQDSKYSLQQDYWIEIPTSAWVTLTQF